MNQREYTGLEVAIIGMACRLPGVSNIHEFWENVKGGIQSLTRFSDKELEEAGVSHDLMRDPKYVRVKGYLKDAEYFDAPFFGYSEKEVMVLDPQVRVLHECAYEALDDAGYDPERFDGLIGFYAGALANYFWEQHVASRVDGFSEQFDAIHLIDKDFLSSRISYKLRLRGPSISLMTACSTSLTSVHMACRALLTGDCRMALAGGVSIMFPLKSGYLYSEGTMLSPDGECRAFDKNAVGTCGGDGAGVVVLKLLEDAIADGDNIYAVIKGTSIHTDGARNISYTASSVEGVADVLKLAQSFSRVEPETISYIEAHGVGTPLGDAIEIEGMKQAFNTDKKGFCAVGSLKPNIGYLGPAAGISGLIKTALAMHHRLIPPSLNYEAPNPMIDFENSPFYINTVLKKWEANGLPLRAGVSSFGVGGSNAHVIMEEAPPMDKYFKRGGYKLLLLSTKGQEALEKATSNLYRHIKDNTEQSLDDIAYTLQTGRRMYGNRRAILCHDRESALYNLASLHPEQTRTFATGGEKYSCIFMFPNQGGQYINMGWELYEYQPLFKEAIGRCSEAFKPFLGYDVIDCLYPSIGGNYPAKDILSLSEAQPLIFTIQYALAKILLSFGITPSALVGHGIGEYAAACISGVFTLEEAARIVALRAGLIKEVSLNVLVDVYGSGEQVVPFIKEGLAIAAVNSSFSCTVQGSPEAIAVLEKSLGEAGIDGRRLSDSIYYNNCAWDSYAENSVRDALSGLSLQSPRFSFIPSSGLGGEEKAVTDMEYWKNNFTGTIDFSGALKRILTDENSILIEIGPGKALSRFVQQHEGKKRGHITLNLLRHQRDNVTDMHQLLDVLGALWCRGIHVDWKNLYASEEGHRVSLPSYPFQHRHFRI